MNIKQAVVSVTLDSAEVAKAVKPLLESQFGSLGKLIKADLEDVDMQLTFAKSAAGVPATAAAVEAKT